MNAAPTTKNNASLNALFPSALNNLLTRQITPNVTNKNKPNVNVNNIRFFILSAGITAAPKNIRNADPTIMINASFIPFAPSSLYNFDTSAKVPRTANKNIASVIVNLNKSIILINPITSEPNIIILDATIIIVTIDL